jgi:hypothetical protein
MTQQGEKAAAKEQSKRHLKTAAAVKCQQRSNGRTNLYVISLVLHVSTNSASRSTMATETTATRPTFITPRMIEAAPVLAPALTCRVPTRTHCLNTHLVLNASQVCHFSGQLDEPFLSNCIRNLLYNQLITQIARQNIEGESDTAKTKSKTIQNV